MNPQLLLRVVVVDPPLGVAFAVQRGRSDLVPPVAESPDSIVFEFPVSIANLSSTPVRFVGEFTQGPPAVRFVYINSGTLAGQSASCWTRRAKVPITGISRELIEQASGRTGARLETRITGKARDGGPSCATVHLLSAWAVVGTSPPAT